MFFVEAFKVIQIAQLARLADTLTAHKSLVTIESEAVVNGTAVTHIQKDCTNSCASAALTRIAMHDNSILRISYKMLQNQLTSNPLKRLLCNLENVVERWAVVVWPVIVGASSSEFTLIVRCSLRCVNNPVLISVSFVQEISNSFNWISIH